MSYNHQATGQKIQQKQTVSLLVDGQNQHMDERHTKLLLDFANQEGYLIIKKAYAYWRKEGEKFEKVWYSLDFDCINVPSLEKNSVDKQLIIDCIKDVSKNQPDKIILVSGDGDFEYLVNVLKKLGIKIIIFAQRRNVNPRLIELADEFCFVEDLPNLVKDETMTTSVQCKLTYHEAINYLLEAIKLSQGKCTKFAFIDQMMRKNFPNYQGVSSICEREGKRFSKFSKFVAAVVAEGKVKINNNQLLLIEEADNLMA